MSSIATVGPSARSSIRFSAATGCAALLVLVWMVAMAQLLWQFEKQRIADTQQLLHFEPSDLPGPPQAAPLGMAKVIYFIDQSCRCGAAALAEIGRLQRASALPLAQFIATPRALADIDARPLTADELARWRDRVPATPSVALWDAQDKLIYFGPIGAGRLCGSAVLGNRYLQTALLNLQHSALQGSLKNSLLQEKEAVAKAWDVVACACSARI